MAQLISSRHKTNRFSIFIMQNDYEYSMFNREVKCSLRPPQTDGYMKKHLQCVYTYYGIGPSYDYRQTSFTLVGDVSECSCDVDPYEGFDWIRVIDGASTEVSQIPVLLATDRPEDGFFGHYLITTPTGTEINGTKTWTDNGIERDDIVFFWLM